MKFERERAWAMPNKWTFTIKPIKKLIGEYMRQSRYLTIDPFSGMYSPAEIRNDINPDMPAQYHEEALEFLDRCEQNHDSPDLMFFDPSYSLRQMKECYEGIGKALTYEHTTDYFSKCKDIIGRIIRTNGICISFGWNSNGLGEGRGFEIERILLVAHGGSHNDTICTVERKTQESLLSYEELG